MSSDAAPTYSVGETAKMLGLPASVVHDLANAGELPFSFTPKGWRFCQAAIDAYRADADHGYSEPSPRPAA